RSPRGPPAGPPPPRGGEPDPHSVADTRGNLDGDLPAGLHPPVAAALVARVRNDFADAAAGRARPRSHHLAEQRALHGLHLAATATGVAGNRRRVAVGAAALASVAEHRGIDGDLLADA